LFLSYCLRHSPGHRYSILEFLIRSNLTDPFPVRRVLIQELTKRTHKIGSAQRAALEYILAAAHEDGASTDAENDELLEPIGRPPMASSPSWFAWCSGTARKALPDTEDRPEEKVPSESETDTPKGPWIAFSVPSAVEKTGWLSDRLGPRERVVAHSFVMAADSVDCATAWFYELCLVLTSERYYLFKVRAPQDIDFPKRWALVWRRPYRAVSRVAVGASRVHVAHRGSDDADPQGEVTTLFTPSRSSAKEICRAFVTLSQAWHQVLTATGSKNPPPPLRLVENGHSDAFRVANGLFSGSPLPSPHGMPFCDLVRFCGAFLFCIILGETCKYS
jgi:hypothetical protein